MKHFSRSICILFMILGLLSASLPARRVDSHGFEQDNAVSRPSLIEAKRIRLRSDLQYKHLQDRVFIKLKKQSVDYSGGFTRSLNIAGYSTTAESFAQKYIHDPEVAAKLRGTDIYDWHGVDVPAGTTVEAFLESALEDPNVEAAEPICLIHATQTIGSQDSGPPDDPMLKDMWNLNNRGDKLGVAGIDVNALKAWPILEQMLLDHPDAPEILIGSNDTGIDYLNADDLKDIIWQNPAEIEDNGIDEDGNGIIDDKHGVNTIRDNTSPGHPLDDNDHGSHTTGTIGAGYNNGIGTVGIIGPLQKKVRIVGVKFINFLGGGNYEDAVKGFMYEYNHKILLSNNSWGGVQPSQVLYDVLKAGQAIGHIAVCAAGNSASDIAIFPEYPGSYAHDPKTPLDNVIAIAAINRKGELAYFSNYGDGVDGAAPGEDITSTVRNNKYSVFSGTSMATPHAVGAMAIIQFAYPQFDYRQRLAKFIGCMRPLESLLGKVRGNGLVDIYNILDVDSIPPAPVKHLKVVPEFKTHRSLILTGIASGDDGIDGQATGYDIRFSKELITEANFNEAQQVVITPVPSKSGIEEIFMVPGLEERTRYYIAIKVRDNVGNWSAMSNVATGKTRKAKKLFAFDLKHPAPGWKVEGTDGVGGPALWHISQSCPDAKDLWSYDREDSCDYDTLGNNIGYLTTDVYDLHDLTNADLTVSYALSTEDHPETYNDLATIQIAEVIDGQKPQFEQLYEAFSTDGVIVSRLFDISAFDGKRVQFKFMFDSVDPVDNRHAGWIIHSVIISATPKHKR